MGIDNLMPEDDSSSSASESSNSQTSSFQETSVSYTGSSRYLSGERWRDIIEIMEEELNIQYAELAELPPDEQETILQEADKLISGMGTWTGTEFEINSRCIVCGHECEEDGVTIEGYKVCRAHSAQEVRTSINNIEETNNE